MVATIGNNTYREEKNLPLLPQDVLTQIETLKTEINDGEITYKGYNNKMKRLLEPYKEPAPTVTLIIP